MRLSLQKAATQDYVLDFVLGLKFLHFLSRRVRKPL